MQDSNEVNFIVKDAARDEIDFLRVTIKFNWILKTYINIFTKTHTHTSKHIYLYIYEYIKDKWIESMIFIKKF